MFQKLRSFLLRGNDDATLNADKCTDKIDLVFLQDTTGSQEPYIKSAVSAIGNICQTVSQKASIPPANIRFGLIAFRDHPPQDDTYVTKTFRFKSSIRAMKRNLRSLDADGGGDGPEAVTAALWKALHMKWNKDAAKLVVLITDAPPHGLGEGGDGFDASPDQHDPIQIARTMAEQGITLFVVACEPTLSEYAHAVDFYDAITEITGGRMFSLTTAAMLGDYIAGTAIETIETEKLVQEFKAEVVDSVYGQSQSIETVMDKIHNKLKARNAHINTIDVTNIYNQSAVADMNKEMWKTASSLAQARGRVSSVGGHRIQSEYASASMAPTVKCELSEASTYHAKKIVAQSLMRSSYVTAEGMSPRS